MEEALAPGAPENALLAPPAVTQEGPVGVFRTCPRGGDRRLLQHAALHACTSKLLRAAYSRRMRRRTLAIGPVMVAMAALFGCDGPSSRSCTEIGCQDGLLVSVAPAEAWPHGSYRFVVVHDGTTTICTGALPLPACETRALSCDGEGVEIVESGCALEASQHAFGDIRLSSTPASITVTVERDGQPIASQSWTPEYKTLQPNGPGCEPTCTSATVELQLAFE